MVLTTLVVEVVVVFVAPGDDDDGDDEGSDFTRLSALVYEAPNIIPREIESEMIDGLCLVS
jgi:hypothetical protein